VPVSWDSMMAKAGANCNNHCNTASHAHVATHDHLNKSRLQQCFVDTNTTASSTHCILIARGVVVQSTQLSYSPHCRTVELSYSPHCKSIFCKHSALTREAASLVVVLWGHVRAPHHSTCITVAAATAAHHVGSRHAPHVVMAPTCCRIHYIELSQARASVTQRLQRHSTWPS
jgi:hypothetical protein